MRVATYNVHGCVGTDRRRSERRIADVIAELGADLVGLQELDRAGQPSANVNQAEMIADQLGWFHCYHPSTRKRCGDQGNGVLSRFPLRLRRAAKLPGKSPPYCPEDRAVIEIEVTTDNG